MVGIIDPAIPPTTQIVLEWFLILLISPFIFTSNTIKILKYCVCFTLTHGLQSFFFQQTNLKCLDAHSISYPPTFIIELFFHNLSEIVDS